MWPPFLFSATRSVVLAKHLLEGLVCPKSKTPLIYFPRGEAGADERDAFLFSPVSGLRYPIHDGFPVLLAEEAIEDDPARLVARAKALSLHVP